ncbi:MAG TPA: phenylalanine 4-monooxygenase [Acidimicrobiales bacterium]
MVSSMFELPDDHPGVADPDYRRRRAEIAAAAETWMPGQPIPTVGYTDEEHAVWATVIGELKEKHERLTSRQFRDGAHALDLPIDHIPQLGELDQRLRELSGFAVEPVPGLVPAREFYGRLADGTFKSTQYVRHTSVPFYTPEPDILHEVAGHLNMLANRDFADLHRLAGETSRRCETDAAHEFFSRVFWYTLEFGVVWESGDLKAYGAGLASSYGEIEEFRNAEIRSYDLVAMGTQDYDITHYQPLLFAMADHAEIVDRVGELFAAFDDEMHLRLVHHHHAA